MGVIILSKERFDDAITADKPVIVDFYADWCGPCKMIAPLFEELASEHPEIAFYKVNVDDAPDIAAKYNVVNIPTFAAFKNGEHIRSISGARPKDEILSLVSS